MVAKQLSETRKPDRAKMAVMLEKLIGECGALYHRTEGAPYPGLQCIQLTIAAAQGLCVRVSLDGQSCQPNVYVLSWHMAAKSTAELSAATFGGSVNPHHRQKATYVAHGFENLCSELRRGLQMAKDGSAFLNAQAQAA